MAQIFEDIVVNGAAFVERLVVGRPVNPSSSALVQILGSGFRATAFTGAGAPVQFNGARGSGSVDAPQPTPSGGAMVSFLGLGFDGVTFAVGGGLDVRAEETFTSIAHGSVAVLRATAVGSTSVVDCIATAVPAAADSMRLQIFDTSAAAFKQVSRGVADSAGAGFRQLRIPN